MTSDQKPADPEKSPSSGGLSAVKPLVPTLFKRIEAVIERAHIPMLASALTFDALLALVPLFLLVFQGLALVLEHTRFFAMANPDRMLNSLLPPHAHGEARDPFAMIEGVVRAVRGYQSKITLVAIPVFLWFGSRVFSTVRSTLSEVYDAREPQRHERLIFDVILGYIFGKLRDFALIGFVVALVLVNTVLTALVHIADQGLLTGTPVVDFFTGALGRILGQVVALGSGLVLFITLYRFASPKRTSWRASALAAVVATVGFELAKRLYALYLAYGARGELYSVDVNVGAVLLFLLWAWWGSFVFLVGAATADVWERGRPHKIAKPPEPRTSGML